MKRVFLSLSMVVILALSSHATYYIVGNSPFGDWNPAVGVEMTPQSDGTYQCKSTINGTIWFVFADGLDADWTVFNSTYRIGPLNGDETVHLDTYVTTQRAGNTGAYKFIGSGSEYIITLNPTTWRFIIEGTYTPPPVTTYTVAGNSTALFGTEWDPANTDNDMEKLANGTYRWQKGRVNLEQGSFEFKVVANHDWGMAYPSRNYYAEVPKAGNYDVEIGFNPSTEEVSCRLTWLGDGGPSLYGDLNGDGEVTIADINVLIDAILAGNMNMEYDVNDDREINIADVSALIDILLNPDIKELTGMILFDWSGDEGKVSVQYTGNENVTMTVVVNGEAVELTNGYFYLSGYGEHFIEVKVTAPGYTILEQSYTIVWDEPAPMPTPIPDIYVEITDDYAIISAVGQGWVRLYIDGVEVGNPFYYERGDEDVVIIVAATAQMEGALVSDPVYMELYVPAKEEPTPKPTPMPEISYEMTDDYVIISAVGQGWVRLFVNGEEMDNPCYIERGEWDMEVEVMAIAQQEGALESEPNIVWITIPAREVGPVDPHMEGMWVVFIDKYGSEVWYELFPDASGNYTTTVNLKNEIFGDWNPDYDTERPNVPLYIVVDGVRYGSGENYEMPVFGNASENPLYAESENCYAIPFGYKYTIGIAIDYYSGDMYLAVTIAPY